MPEKRPIPAPIPEEILEALQRYAWRVRVVRLVRGTGVTLAVGAALLLGALLLDRFVYLEPPHRVLVTGAVAAAAAIAFLLAVVAPLLRPLGPFRLALGLEAACPELRERLVTALELLRAEAPSGSEELATRLVSSTADALADLPVGRLVRWRPALARLAAGAAAALLLAALAAGDPEGHALLLARFLHPTRDLPRPSDVFLAVLPGSGVAPLGEDVTVRATVLAGRPERAELLLDRGDGFRPLEMKRGDGQFSGTVPRPRGPFAYHVASSRFRSPTYRIEVRERPAARSFDVLYTYPATTRLPPARATSTSGALSAPAGSVAEIAVRCSRPVAAARLHVSGEEPVNAAPEGDTVRVTVPVRRPGSWRLWLEDSDRISNLWGEVHPIDAVPDRPPQVRAIEPREAVRVETAAPVEVKFEASDDHGVRAIETRIDRGRGEVLKVPVPVGDPPPDRRAPDGRVTALAGAFRLDLAELGMEPGERLEWRLAAVDEAGQEGLSPPRSIELALAPPPPEGEGWNARLDAIGAEIEKALAAAAACATAAAHGGEALPIDEALADRLSERSRELEELRMSFPRLSDDVRATARRIAFPSANRPALEGLARRLGDVASGSLAAFAGELLRATGAIREALRARGKAGAPGPASVPVEALASGGRLLGEDLARSAALFAAIHREERLEASVEGLIELGAALRRLGSHLDPKRKETRGLVRTLWSRLRERGDELSGDLAATGKLGGAGVQPILEAARALRDGLEAASGRLGPALLEEGTEAALRETAAAESVASAAEKSARALLEDARKAAAEARAALALEPDLPALASSLAAAAGAFLEGAQQGKSGPAAAALEAALAALRKLRAELRREARRAEDREAPDFETSTLLLELDQVLEGSERELAGATLLAAGLEGLAEEARAGRLARMAQAAEGAAPVARGAPQALGDLELDRRASALQARLEPCGRGQEAAAAQAAAAEPGQERALRALAAREDDLALELESLDAAARAALEPLRKDHPEAVAGLLGALEAVPRAAAGARDAAGLLRGRKPAEAAARVEGPARALADAAARLAALRAAGLPHRERARAWILARRGALPDRIASLADRQGKLRESTGAVPPASKEAFEARAAEQEGLEREARELARSASREADRLSFARASSPQAAARLSARARDLDGAARTLSLVASGDMRDARSALTRAAAADGDALTAALAGALAKQEAARAALAALAGALRAVEAGEAAGEAAERAEAMAAQAAAASPGGAEPSIDQLRAQAAALHGAALELLERLSASLAEGPFKAEVLGALRSASEELVAAAEAATAGNAALASQRLAAGRGHLDRAAALLRGAHQEAEAREALAREDLSKEEEGEPASRELQETYAELARLRSLRAWEGQVEVEIGGLLALAEGAGEEGAKDAAAQELARRQEKLAEELAAKTVSRAQLVALAADLLRLQRRAREHAEEEKAILAALGSLGDPGSLGAGEGGGALRERQDAATRAALESLGGIRKAGAGLTIHLPSVLKAFWDADAHIDPASAALEEAAAALARDSAGAAREPARKAAVELTVLADLLDIVRERALEEIARTEDESERVRLERGGLDAALEVLRESARLLRSGDLAAAASRARQGARGLEAAAGALRLSLADRDLFDVEEGHLSSRLVAPGRIGTALAWKAVYRGEELSPPGAGEASGPGEASGLEAEAGFPEEFRDLVRAYLKALAELRP